MIQMMIELCATTMERRYGGNEDGGGDGDGDAMRGVDDDDGDDVDELLLMMLEMPIGSWYC